MSEVQTSSERPKKPLTGVRGWFLFLCLSLVFFLPIITLGAVLKIFDTPGIKQNELLYNTLWYASLPTIGVIIFSIVAGISLWSVATHAIKITYTFFVYLLVSEFLLTPLIILDRLNLHYTQLMDAQDVVGNLFYVLLWGTYLARSKRVKNTFVSPPDRRRHDYSF
jgi:hypothetical protein